MAEYFIEGSSSLNFESIDVITGGDDPGKYLLYQMRKSIAHAKQIDIIVSFLMESGVKLILKDLRGAIDRGVTVRLLTGNYLGITQPSALYLIKGSWETALTCGFITRRTAPSIQRRISFIMNRRARFLSARRMCRAAR